MYSLMNVANVYPTQKKDKSYRAVQHGFVKTLFHILFLLLAIVIMAVYYSQIKETKRKSIQVDKTKTDWIPYSSYNELETYKNEQDTILHCECSRNQIAWHGITDSIDITDDYVCTALLVGYNSCYLDSICRNGEVGKIIFNYLYELCENAQSIYPLNRIEESLSSGRVFTNDELHGIAYQLATNLRDDIARSFQATYYMTYPLINHDTKLFYGWSLTTTFEDLENATYWQSVWGLSNSSYGIADAFSDIHYDALGYLLISDAIDSAFIDNIEIIYRYSNTSYVENGHHAGYYQMCAPYQCIWFTTETKTFLEITVTIFGVLGGIHASLFVVINIGHAIYKKMFKIKFDSEEEEKDKLEMTIQQTAIIKAEPDDHN